MAISKSKKMLDSWHYYTLGQEEYSLCMGKLLPHNLHSLAQANMVVAFLAFCFTLFPILVENDFRKAGVYLAVAAIALLLLLAASYRFRQHKQGRQIGSMQIYLLTAAYFANIIAFGVYIGVWASPDGTAVSIMIFLICAFLLFVNPPEFNFVLTFCAMAVFIAFTIAVKEPQNWIFDVVNTVMAGSISLYFCWQITMLRMVSVLNATKLEEERNKYLSQSTVDELTQLKNRRDFMQTFQRRLDHYRSSDEWMCIAIMDIDFFKNYNDHYGHPQGDECLRSIGRTLTELGKNMNVYIARVGGEEFALIWYEKDTANILNSAARVQRAISDLNIPHEKSSVAPHVTISVGIHTLRCGSSNNLEALYDYADKALYAAKKNGRNRAVVYEG